MTTFLLSHNLQVISQKTPGFSPGELELALKSALPEEISLEDLTHPHWIIKVNSSKSPILLGEEVLNAWRKMRINHGHDSNHSLLALGGRKDSAGTQGSPLEKGYWGVDVVETKDPGGFLESINWNELKAGRPADGVFEIFNHPT